jgi:hypothetical protein
MGERFDRRVDDYIGALPRWQVELCDRLREVIHDADPAVEETVKRTGQPYFVLEGNVCAFLAARDHVHLFTYDGAIVADPEGIITGGHGNSTARTIAFYECDAVPAQALTVLLRQIIANNRAGGWRAVKAATPLRRSSDG